MCWCVARRAPYRRATRPSVPQSSLRPRVQAHRWRRAKWRRGVSSVRVEGNIMPDHQGKRLRGIAERLSSAGLSLQENMVRKAILIAFADAGQGPSVEALTHALGLPLAAVRAACRTLAGADLILGQDEKRAISSAYP